MESRVLGRSGLVVSAVGFGCMRLSESSMPQPAGAAIAVIHRAIDLDITLFDTADIYGYGHNERLVGQALLGRRHRAVIATKCGIIRRGARKTLNGTPRYLRAACEASLRRLHTDYVDLLYLHRVDPKVPIEESVGALGALVAEGKARAIGLSKTTPDIVRRAAAVHPLAAVQMRYSVRERAVEASLLNVARAVGAAMVAYAPLGEGLLTPRAASVSALNRTDGRWRSQRFQGARLDDALAFGRRLDDHARACACSPAQLALAWLLARGRDVVPIPGMRTRAHLEDNVGATRLAVPDRVFSALEREPTAAC